MKESFLRELKRKRPAGSNLTGRYPASWVKQHVFRLDRAATRKSLGRQMPPTRRWRLPTKQRHHVG